LASNLRYLVAEGEPPEARQQRRQSTGRSSGETFIDILHRLSPGATIDRLKPADGEQEGQSALASYDGVFLTGSPLHLYRDTPEARRQVEFMRAVFASGTPAFGSCAGLQVATVAAGGSVRPMARAERGLARRITPTPSGRSHPLLEGRPAAYDAPAVHADEVDRLPDGAVHLASNVATTVQAAEIRYAGGVFWGVQYHPEISLGEVVAALRRDAESLAQDGLAGSDGDLELYLGMLETLDAAPDRRDLAWRLGIDEEVLDFDHRTRELQNFIRGLVIPTKSDRGSR
jgi:GMP synthase (glutamine-hydrolysing)